MNLTFSPDAFAQIQGSPLAPSLNGWVLFYSLPEGGVLIEAMLTGLPDTDSAPSNFYAFHIHETGDCSHDFSHTGNHYNPAGMPHPFHAGDLPPLLSSKGTAWCAFYDGRFSLEEVLGRSVIIHRNADDFTTQPSGNSGEKIGCGVIGPSI